MPSIFPAPTLFYREKLKDQAVTDVARFLSVEREQVFDLAAAWLEIGPRLFAEKRPEDFYTAWQGEAGRSNLCSNAIFQFQRPDIWSALHQIASQFEDLTYLDFGCGSATLSFPFLKAFRQAVLTDVPNLAQEFVQWRIRQHGLSNTVVLPPALLEGQSACANIVTCIDVLEHVATSTELFLKIDTLLATGGLFLFSAPWHSIDSQPEHLPEAEADWKRPGGGQAIMNERYQCLKPFMAGGIFRKLSDA